MQTLSAGSVQVIFSSLVRAVASSIIGGKTDIYISCIMKEINCAEHEYMNIMHAPSLPPIIGLATALHLYAHISFKCLQFYTIVLMSIIWPNETIPHLI